VVFKPFCTQSNGCFKWVGDACRKQGADLVRSMRHFSWMNSKGRIKAYNLNDCMQCDTLTVQMKMIFTQLWCKCLYWIGLVREGPNDGSS